MKIERINENQIRCTLTSFDLSARNLNLGELAYGSEKARNLFREMIQKASSEVGFEAEDIPLMVEAIPLSNESVMLVITKIEDPEELDTRFSKFSPGSEEDTEGMFTDLASELLEGADGLLSLLSSDEADEDRPSSKPAKSPSQNERKSDSQEPSANTLRIYCFESLDHISDAARIVAPMFTGKSTVYKKPGTRQYYLTLHDEEGNSKEFSRICNILAEYGAKSRSDAACEAYFLEHYEAISKDHALQVLKDI